MELISSITTCHVVDSSKAFCWVLFHCFFQILWIVPLNIYLDFYSICILWAQQRAANNCHHCLKPTEGVGGVKPRESFVIFISYFFCWINCSTSFSLPPALSKCFLIWLCWRDRDWDKVQVINKRRCSSTKALRITVSV